MRHAIALIGLVLLASTACGDDDDTSAGDGKAGSDPFGNSTSKPTQVGSSGSGSHAGTNGADGADGGKACDKSLRLVVRDFTEMHPDFEAYTGNGLDGIVKEDLGSDHKPVYASDGPTALTTGPDEFADWYHDVDGVNQRFEVDIQFMQAGGGLYVYDNPAFFPIDGRGFGNGPDQSHNYLFTTEAHTLFTYTGSEVFTFRGDDDLWVFINGKLAVDLGGLHAPLEESVDFDDNADKLGIEIGQTYPMDIFHAERHTVQSNFRIQTTIDLSCIHNVSVE